MKIRIANKIIKYDDFDIHETYNKYQIKKALERINKHSVREAHKRSLRRLKTVMIKNQKPLDKIDYFINLIMGIYGVNKIIIDGKTYRYKKDKK